MLSRVLWALMLAGVVTGITGWWFDWDFYKTFNIGKDFADSSDFNSSSLSFGQLKDSVAGVVGGGRENVNEVFQGAVQKQKNVVIGTVNEVKDSITKGTKNQLGQVLRSFEESLGVMDLGDVDDGGSGLAFAMVMVTRVDESVDFLIKNSSNLTISYLIKWGDGELSNGFLTAEEEKIIQHTWRSVGNYFISFGSKKFVIRVIK